MTISKIEALIAYRTQSKTFLNMTRFDVIFGQNHASIDCTCSIHCDTLEKTTEYQDVMNNIWKKVKQMLPKHKKKK